MRVSSLITIDLTAKGETVYKVEKSNRLWINKAVPLRSAGTLVMFDQEDLSAVIAVRFSLDDELIAMGTDDTLVQKISGEFDKLYLTVVSAAAGAKTLYLNTGTDVDIELGAVTLIAS